MSEQASRSLRTISEDPYNAETPLGALLDETTKAEFVYVRNHFELPTIDPSEWSLETGGLVEPARSFSISEISALPSKSIVMTLECAGNGRKSMKPLPAGTRWGYGAVSIVEFTGTPAFQLLDEMGIRGDPVEVVFYGADRGEVAPGRSEPYARSLPLKLARHPDTLLAWEMNGEPLSPNHGFPLRLVVPGWYGMASVKWLHKIEISETEFEGFFQKEHYVYKEEDGTPEGEPVRHMRVRSLILNVGDQDGGKMALEGIAWSGSGGISKVEISQDDGSTWQDADVEPPFSKYRNQRWKSIISGPFEAPITIISRATDTEGNTQPTSDRWNRLGYGNNGVHSVQIRPSK